MRKLLSILLLALFGVTAAAPLLALGQTPESRLPACCRRSGDHHCAGNMAQQMEMGQPSPNPSFAPPAPQCPYAPGTLPTQHLSPILATTFAAFEAPLEVSSRLSRLNPATRRTSDEPSLPKRGPPTSSHS